MADDLAGQLNRAITKINLLNAKQKRLVEAIERLAAQVRHDEKEAKAAASQKERDAEEIKR